MEVPHLNCHIFF